jgi:hypothetical protein
MLVNLFIPCELASELSKSAWLPTITLAPDNSSGLRWKISINEGGTAATSPFKHQ